MLVPGGTVCNVSPEIRREQARVLHDNLPYALGGILVTASTVAIVLWGYGRHEILLAWLAAIYLLSLVRWQVRAIFLRQPADFDADRWLWIYAALSFTSGCIWGSVGILLFQHEPVVLLTLMIMYAGMLAGSVPAHAIFLPTYVAYALPTSLPFALYSISLLDSFYVMIGVLSLMFVSVNIYFARNIQRSLVESIRLRFENVVLVGQLMEERDVAERARAEAERATATKTRFLAAASHDLRQPTQALEFFIDALDHDVRDPALRPLIDNISATGRSLRELLDTLLDFSRIDAAAIQPAVRSFPIAEVFQHIGREFSPLAAGYGLRLHMVPTSAWVASDPALLERILRNLVANAIRYTVSGGVLVGCRRQGDALRIEVHDSGPGIPAGLQNEVFREFYQVANPERDREKGLGLGLAIVDGLARLLGHPIGLRSVPGRGSTFAVTVPRAPIDTLRENRHTPVPDDLAGHIVLVVDDDVAIREAARQLLERWGCRVVAAASASDAVAALAGRMPDIVLTDYRLGAGATGIDAIVAVRAHCGHDIPAAILTGDIAPERLRAVNDLGFPLLHKPLSGGKLRALLTSLLARTGDQRL